MTRRDLARELQEYIHYLQADTEINLRAPKAVLADVLTKVEAALYEAK